MKLVYRPKERFYFDSYTGERKNIVSHYLREEGDYTDDIISVVASINDYNRDAVRDGKHIVKAVNMHEDLLGLVQMFYGAHRHILSPSSQDFIYKILARAEDVLLKSETHAQAQSRTGSTVEYADALLGELAKELK